MKHLERCARCGLPTHDWTRHGREIVCRFCERSDRSDASDRSDTLKRAGSAMAVTAWLVLAGLIVGALALNL